MAEGMRVNYALAAQTIKDSISALDVGTAMGLEIRHGRCQCPLHGGHDYNCVLYKGDRGFYCHVCKQGGDVIRFVQEYHKMRFPDAVRWINDAFHLGLDIDAPMNTEAVKQAENAVKTREREREYAEWKERMRFDLALAADMIVERLEEVRDKRRPRTYGEWDPVFCKAVVTLPEARRFAEDCMMDCMKEKKE